MRLIVLGFMFFILINFHSSFAETIYLKDGKTITGRIASKDEISMMVQECQPPTKVFNFQVERIEGEAFSVDQTQGEDLSEVTDKSELIKKFLEVNGTKATLERDFQAIVAKAPEGKREIFEDVFSVDKVIELAIPAYDSRFDEDELRAIVKFYQSSAGQKLTSSMMSVMQETTMASAKYFKEREAELK